MWLTLSENGNDEMDVAVPLGAVMFREIRSKETESSAEGEDKLITPMTTTLDAPSEVIKSGNKYQ